MIKHIVEFIEQNDEDFVIEAIETLEHISQAKGLTDEELSVIGELLSNMSGAVAVAKDIKKGTEKKDALNKFMQRVMKSIGK